MFAFFKRLFGIGKAKETAPTPTVVDKQKAPEKMTTQEIKILKAELDSELQKLAKAKAIAIRTERDIENNKQLPQAQKQYEENLAKKQKYDGIVAELETNIRQLKSIIRAWEQRNSTMGIIAVKGIAKIKIPDKVNYSDTATPETNIDAEIEAALKAAKTPNGMTLDELKHKMGNSSHEADHTENKDKPNE